MVDPPQWGDKASASPTLLPVILWPSSVDWHYHGYNEPRGKKLSMFEAESTNGHHPNDEDFTNGIPSFPLGIIDEVDREEIRAYI